MKISRISESMGLISDEISQRAIESFEKKSEKSNSISSEKPRVIREEKSHKAPIIIALAGLCAAAAIAVPFALKNTGKNEIVASENLSGAADSVSESILDEKITQKVRDNIILQMNLPQTAPSELPTVKLTLKKWNSEQTKNLFFDGKEITLEQENYSNYYSNQKIYSWDTEDEMVVIEPGRFSYWDKAALDGESKYGSVFSYRCDDCNLIDDNYASDKELSAFSKADAKKLADEMIDKIGITNLGEPKIIAVTADAANKILERYSEWISGDGEEKDTSEPFTYTPWTENEEAYILRYPQVFENIELTMNGVQYARLDGGDGVTRDSGVVVYVAKDKVLRLDASQIYDENYKTVENISVNYSANQALVTLKDYLSKQDWEKTVKYYNCKMTYVPYNCSYDEMTVWYKPAWEFAGYRMPVESWETGLSSTLQGGQEYEYVYADTGRIHVTNMGDDVKIPEGSNIGAKAERLKLTFDGKDISVVPDDVNPNVNFVTVKFDREKNDKFGIVVNPDGTFELYRGDDVTEEKIIKNIPEDSFGYMIAFNNPGWEWKCSEFDYNNPIYRDISDYGVINGYYTIQLWVSNSNDIKDIETKQNGILKIYDNGNGTYSAVIVTQAKSSVPPKN
ncbi:MAG: hypothetical protein ACI4JZ_08150 [Oscillospiraceae bacterium]